MISRLGEVLPSRSEAQIRTHHLKMVKMFGVCVVGCPAYQVGEEHVADTQHPGQDRDAFFGLSVFEVERQNAQIAVFLEVLNSDSIPLACADQAHRFQRAQCLSERRFVVDRVAISRIIVQMAAKGLITRRLAAGDARARAIEITALGRRRLAGGTAAAEDNAAHLRAQLTAEEYAALDAIMNKLMTGGDAPLKGL